MRKFRVLVPVTAASTIFCLFFFYWQPPLTVTEPSLKPLALTCGSKDLDLLIIVYSALTGFEKRQAVRETWGSWKNTNYTTSLYFILGRSTDDKLNQLVQYEQEIYQDLLLNDFIDVYVNLTYKGIAMLKVLSENCPNVPFVLKADDDTFVNIPNLVKAAYRFPLQRNVIFGTLFTKGTPIRDPSSKWYLSKTEYPSRSFPDLLAGPAYVMSGDVPAKLYAVNSNTRYVSLEDVYITGILAEKANVTRLNCEGFENWKRRSTCIYRHVISGHYVTPNEMIRIWSDISTKC